MSTDPLDNDGRAGFAAAALAAYHSETRSSPDTYGDEGSEQFVQTFGDLLSDLQHLAKRAGVDFDELLYNGTYHFECEVGEEEELARQEAERIRLETAPIDEQVYAVITDDFQHFVKFRATGGIPVSEIRWSLLRLQEQGKIEQVYGSGWRRVPEPAAAEESAAEPEPPAVAVKPPSDALREIFVHMALSPDWTAETLDGIAEIHGTTGQPSIGDMEQVDYWISEAQRLGIWHMYEDNTRDWAEHNGIKLDVFRGETDEALG